ncbi:FAD binding domain-containing protein [Variovorax saccharolyticus]|uniref:FAD binding domain-containing protein n=1 Tax=Variovorax saccharolyticus TaxID=3053516 RepID=UPI00257675C9|nr:xanthine dehydrogenase family protein subunit M [Variovorax sp. J22R187]MDM0022212.1 xanthine dehydrogenase family protein subunit M [Variovorax sp. J22R187]
MYETDYEHPLTLAEAVQALKRTGGRPLAGGQTLVAAMKTRLSQPGTLVDIAGVPGLRGVRITGTSILIGAMTRHVDVASSPEVMRAIPALAHLAGGIGDRQVRNMGTVGGSVANNDPAACYPAAVLALGAIIHTSERAIPAEKFFVSMYETSLNEDELITEVEFPIPRRAGYVKFEQQASRFALVGVFVADTGTGVRVAVTGAASVVFRVAEIERSLTTAFTPESAKSATVSSKDLSSDIHATSEYRAHLIAVIAAQAVSQALAG